MTEVVLLRVMSRVITGPGAETLLMVYCPIVKVSL